MRSRLFALVATVFALTGLASVASAAPKSPPALTGKVSSAEEGAMEGVVVSAKKFSSQLGRGDEREETRHYHRQISSRALGDGAP
jgi:hypothetical protein